jgi:hypothetical protein
MRRSASVPDVLSSMRASFDEEITKIYGGEEWIQKWAGNRGNTFLRRQTKKQRDGCGVKKPTEDSLQVYSTYVLSMRASFDEDLCMEKSGYRNGRAIGATPFYVDRQRKRGWLCGGGGRV